MRELAKISNLYFFKKEALSIRGIPDIIICVNGQFVAWELKRSLQEACKTTGRIALQRHTMQQIQQAGGFARLVYPENFEECLNDLKRLAFAYE